MKNDFDIFILAYLTYAFLKFYFLGLVVVQDGQGTHYVTYLEFSFTFNDHDKHQDQKQLATKGLFGLQVIVHPQWMPRPELQAET